MTHVATIEYNKVNFRWIQSHWDIHLAGTCTYNGEICFFKTQQDEYDSVAEEFLNITVKIFKLTLIEKIKLVMRQWFFEKCVGYHNTYGVKGKKRNFYYRTPQWFYKLLFRLYYKLK